MIKPFFLVLARNEKYVDEKIEELKRLGIPYVIICGGNINHPNVFYRKPEGKFDAINFGARFVSEYADVVVLNDVDTKIVNFRTALKHFKHKEVGLVFAKVFVKEGPQRLFYVILNSIRRRLPLAASGELMLIRRNVFTRILPIRPCKAEDSYILFKVLELGLSLIHISEPTRPY